MPYKSEQIPIAGSVYDKRQKLSNEQKRAIKVLSEQGYSQRKLAAIFRCSKSSIQNIQKPFKRYFQKKRPTSYWTEAKRRYRINKQHLYLSGILQEDKRLKPE